jgi:ATP-dependent Zn protease
MMAFIPALIPADWRTSLMNEWLSLLMSWLPFLLLIGVWVWLSRGVGMRARGRSGITMIELYEQQVEETRRMNITLERIAAALEKRGRLWGG